MNATVSMESILNLLQSFSDDNKKWLADKLYEQIGHGKKEKELVFPHIPKDYKLSRETLRMVEDRLPVEIDVETEEKRMWEDWAK